MAARGVGCSGGLVVLELLVDLDSPEVRANPADRADRKEPEVLEVVAAAAAEVASAAVVAAVVLVHNEDNVPEALPVSLAIDALAGKMAFMAQCS